MATGDWQLLLREASQLHAAGRVDDAIAVYRRLLAINPDLPDSWFNLGWLERQTRQFEAALQSYQKALDLGVPSPEEVHLNRAAIFSDHLRQPGRTEAELLAALELRPGFVPALLNLGNLREDLGQREEAAHAYRRVLEADPDNPLALARLATLSLSPELDHELAHRLRETITRAQSAGAQPAGLMFALSALLDAGGHYDEAFAAAHAANAASRSAAGSAAAYNRAATERFVDRSIAAFVRPADQEHRNGSPVFICGMYRSGSTLLEQILAGHSEVTATGELDLIPALAAQIHGYPEAAASADRSAVEQWREFYLRTLPAGLDGGIMTDKRPDNFLHIGLIKTIFPTAKILHTVRDPLDNLLSLYFLHLDPRMAYALDLEDAVHWYGQYRRLMQHWESLYGNDILPVDYDRLVQEPRESVGEALRFLGLEWEDSCLEFNRSGEMVRTASVWQVREPLYRRSSGRWRNYERQLESTRRALALL